MADKQRARTTQAKERSSVARIGRLIGVLLLALVVKTLYDAGELTTQEYVNPFTKCTTFSGAAIAEKMSLDQETGTLFIAAADMQVVMGKGEDSSLTYPSGIYRVDLNAQKLVLQPVEVVGLDVKDTFFHGNDIYRAKDGTLVFMSINHGIGLSKNVVEVFHYKDGKMYHQETIATSDMVSLNDITIIGPRSFYTSNDHAAPHFHPMQLVEDFGQFAWSNVIYFNGDTNKSSVVADHIVSSNGVAFSNDRKKVYIAAAVGKELRVYDHLANHSLALESILKFPGGLDNIFVDAENSLWITVHPKLLHALIAINGFIQRSPSMVARLDPVDKSFSTFKVTTFYHNNGTEISALTSAVRYKNKVALSGIKTNAIMICDF